MDGRIRSDLLSKLWTRSSGVSASHGVIYHVKCDFDHLQG